MGVALLGATLVGCSTPDVALTNDEFKTAIDKAKAEGEASVDITSDNAQIAADATAAVDITSDNAQVATDAVAGLTAEQVPDAIQQQILEDAKEAEVEVEAETEAKGYNVDDLKIGAEFNNTISDRDLKVLFDDEVKFDGDWVDAEEIYTLTDLKIAINENDYNGKAYLQVPEEGILYEWTAAADLKTADITPDETLEFKFLGEDVEVTDWSDDEITFTKGIEKSLGIGEEYNYLNETKIVVDRIGKDSVRLLVNGESLFLDKGESRDIEDVEIKLIRILDSDEIPSRDMVVLEIGEDVENTIKDGEEYSKDSIWDYVVAEGTLTFGLVLNEEFMDRDDDEDYQALDVGEEICLPNNYVCVRYDGLTEEDMQEYDFDLDTKSGEKYVRAKGNFLYGIEDYNKIYINASGIYDDDLEFIHETEIELEDTELTLTSNGTYLTIDDIEIKLDLTEILVASDNICSEEDDYLTSYGITIDGSDDKCEDEEFTITVPEEELTAEITVLSK